MKRYATVVLAGVLAGAGHAQNFFAGDDPQVVQAINEVAFVYQSFCNNGNMQACNMGPMIQQGGQETLALGRNCQMGDQAACSSYQEHLMELQAAHSQAVNAYQQLQSAQYAGQGAGDGLTHQQRMQQIQQWGAQNQANYQSRMQQMDRSHQQFLDMLRE